MPILVLLVMAIFQFAYVLETQVGLTNAAREAARRVAAGEDPAPAWVGAGNPLEQWVQSQLCGDLAGDCGPSGLLAANVQAFDGSKVDPNPPTVEFCRYSVDIDGTATDQFRVTVEIHYKHPVFFGLLSYATDLVDGAANGYWDLTVTAQMRMENIDTADSGYTDPGLCS